MPRTELRDLVNLPRLEAEMDRDGVEVLVLAAPENTAYLSGLLIRTQVSIRDRLAVVIWPRQDEPTYVVCNIEESLALTEGGIDDVRTYVEFAESPIAATCTVLRERGLDTKRIGFEERFLVTKYFRELTTTLPNATLVATDFLMERVRSVKTPGEIARITDAYRRTEGIVRRAWTASRVGDTEKMVADRMLFEALQDGSAGLRHMTLSSGENTPHAHQTPGGRVLREGDIILTDVGFHFSGFASDMARMGIVGRPSAETRSEYDRYRDVYMRLLEFVKPGMPASELYEFCRREFEKNGMPMTSPHVGHSLFRSAAMRRGSLLDVGLMSMAVFGQSMPSFWLGILLILLFAVNLRWLPSSGSGELRHVVLPAITLSFFILPQVLLLTRSAMLDSSSSRPCRSAA